MKITKRNGSVVVFDDEKIINSVLRANAEVPSEKIGKKKAAAIADTVFDRVTMNKSIISTAEVRSCTYTVLKECGYPLTAEHYING